MSNKESVPQEAGLSPELMEVVSVSTQVFKDHLTSNGLAEAITDDHHNAKLLDRKATLEREIAVQELEQQLLGKSKYSPEETELAGMKLAHEYMPKSSEKDKLEGAIKMAEQRAIQSGKRAFLTNALFKYVGGSSIGTNQDRLEAIDRRVSLCSEVVKNVPENHQGLDSLLTERYSANREDIGQLRYTTTLRLFEKISKMKSAISTNFA